MAVPKRRKSHSTTRQGRNHKKIIFPVFVICPHCKNKKLPHKVCVSCGYYKDQEIVKV